MTLILLPSRIIAVLIKIFYIKKITLDFKSDFLKNLFKGILQEVFKKNFEEIVQKDVNFQNDDIATNPFIESQLQTNMDKRPSRANWKRKDKAPVVQPNEIRKASTKISDKHESISIETISLQDTLLAEAMYSFGEKSEILQEVLCTDLTFQNGEFTYLHFHIKLLLDNLQAAFSLKQKYLFQKTLKALKLRLVSTSAFIKALGS